jgi:hypothetical protein
MIIILSIYILIYCEWVFYYYANSALKERTRIKHFDFEIVFIPYVSAFQMQSNMKCRNSVLKGTVPRDFRLQVFFHVSVSPSYLSHCYRGIQICIGYIVTLTEGAAVTGAAATEAAATGEAATGAATKGGSAATGKAARGKRSSHGSGSHVSNRRRIAA